MNEYDGDEGDVVFAIGSPNRLWQGGSTSLIHLFIFKNKKMNKLIRNDNGQDVGRVACA